MELSCPLGTTRRVPQEKLTKSHIMNPLLNKFVGQDEWILTSFFFCEFMDLNSVSVNRLAKNELGQYPAILTSHLVNTLAGYYGFNTNISRSHFKQSQICLLIPHIYVLICFVNVSGTNSVSQRISTIYVI